ncbi:MAG TPA: hypothetical protein H9887_08065 [Candidatus Dorea intestinavium]|nr:hypothetical protein [Candidatus Dorea intestinavium]
MKKVYSFLGKKGFKLNSNLLKPEKIDEARYHLAMTKMRKTPDELRAMLKKRYKWGDKAAHLMVKLSRGKRKFCITEFTFETELEPEEFLEKVTDIIMNNTKKHFYMNVAANPDHYVLVGTKGNTSEILECPAELPLPFRFGGIMMMYQTYIQRWEKVLPID